MKNFLDNINLPGGHILLLMVISVLAACAHKWGIPKMDEIAHDAFVALLAILGAKGMSTLSVVAPNASV